VPDRELPEELREISAQLSDQELVGGNLRIYPLDSDDPEALTVANAADKLRSWDWPVPEQLVVFGDDGQGDSFGVWLPADGGARPVVVQIGQVFEEACMAVVGDDLASFLRGWGAYYAALTEDEEVIEEVPEFRLPDELALKDDGSDEEFHAIMRWANPNLPDPRPDPYERGLTAAEVDAIARRGISK
jgi:hypothetical protein